ncbi:MAG TPA: hypothetical protein P5155_01490 [Candidatus Absconditabacterales bacterium]|nr:hypothetical protein [Candidatus Absconditabacterales bacterium]
MKLEEMINKVHCGDCLEFMKQIPDKSIDLVLTDPPYGIGMNKHFGNGANEKMYISDDDWDLDIPDKQYFDEIFRISKNQIIWGGNYFIKYLEPKMCRIVRDKNNGESTFSDGELARTSFDTALRIRKEHCTGGSMGYTEDTKGVNLFGKDKNHDFIYNHEIKKIQIDGEKSTDPDIEIVLKNGNKFLLELKTANKDIFSIKRGNVESLFSSVANYEQFCLIMMLDLAKGLFEIKDLTYFETQKPFSNANMEGQICYNFPTPNTGIETLTKINFDSFANLLVLENIWVKKFKLLKIAIEKENKTWKKIIENKIKLEKLEEEMNINIDDFKDRIEKIKVKTPEVEMSWEKIESEIKKI